MLVVNEAIRIRDASDGTSNTLIIGEQSDQYFDATGNTVQLGGGGWGMLMGTSEMGTGTAFPVGGSDGRAYNITTIRYPPSVRSVIAEQTDGVTGHYGYNIPLSSPHPGGTHALAADGHVAFISENINMDTFRFLATRDDGRVIGEY
jgi:prepilin-type processing-associated H-X9-DG protein